jgi:hypothetical protein
MKQVPRPRRRRVASLAVGSLAAAVVLALLAAPARAHVPHDVAELLAVSPDFAQDRTLAAVFFLTDHRLLGLSDDEGRSWHLYGQPMLAYQVSALAFSPGFAADRTLFAATAGGGVHRSTDGGLHWSPANDGLTDLKVLSLAVSPGFSADGLLLAATPSGCFRSTDGGGHWSPSSSGLVQTSLSSVTFAGPAAFAAGSVIHRSDDGGQTWVPQMAFAHTVVDIAPSPHFALDATLAVSFGRYGDGVRLSTDGGASWGPMVAGLTDAFVNDLAIAEDGTFFAVTKTAGCFRAPAPLANWKLLVDGFEELTAQTTNHFASVGVSPQFSVDNKVFVAAFEGFFHSTDAGDHWLQSDVYSQRLNRRIAFSPGWAQDRRIVLGNYGGGPLLSVDLPPPAGAAGGVAIGAPTAASVPATVAAARGVGQPTHWAPQASGIADLGMFADVLALSPSYPSDHTLFTAYVGMYRSTDDGEHWTQVPYPALIARGFAFSPGFAVDRTVFSGSTSEGVFRSTDAGDHWTQLTIGLPPSLAVSAIQASPAYTCDATVFLAAWNGGVYRTQDGGASWTKTSAGLPGDEIRALRLSPAFESDATLFAGHIGGGVSVSHDAGGSWSAANAGLPAGVPLIVEGLAVSPTFASDGTVFVSLLGDGVWRSVDGGASWSAAQAGLPLDAKRSIEISPDFASDRTLLVSTYDWTWMSTDAGASWWRLPGLIRVNESHPAVRTSGTWSALNTAGCNGQGVHVSVSAGDWTELEFRGDSIAWFAATGPGAGNAAVFVDGVRQASLDLSAAAASPSAAAYSLGFAQVGWHTIRVVNLGAQPGNPAAAIASDGFQYSF